MLVLNFLAIVEALAQLRGLERGSISESARFARTDCAHRTHVAPSSTRRRGMLYLCISVGNIEKECRRKAVSCKGELYPREREGKRVHTLLTQRVTFLLRVSYVKSHSSGFGPQRVKEKCLRLFVVVVVMVIHMRTKFHLHACYS